MGDHISSVSSTPKTTVYTATTPSFNPNAHSGTSVQTTQTSVSTNSGTNSNTNSNALKNFYPGLIEAASKLFSGTTSSPVQFGVSLLPQAMKTMGMGQFSGTVGMAVNALQNPSSLVMGLGTAIAPAAISTLMAGGTMAAALTTGLSSIGLGGIATSLGLPSLASIGAPAGGAIGMGGAFASLGSTMTSVGAFLVTNPVGWAIMGGIAAAFIVKAFWGRGLAKAKKNWSKNKAAVVAKLRAQGVPEQYLESLSSQMAFDSLSDKDKRKLLKKAKKSPNGEAAQIVKAAGYDASTFDGKNIETATKLYDVGKEYYKATGKIISDMDISADFKSSANTAERASASAELTLIDANKDGRVSMDELKAYYNSPNTKFASMKPEEMDAALRAKGYAIDINELKDSTGNITAESFSSYFFEELDQKTIFKANKLDGSIAASSDGTISAEEFNDAFIQPKQSDWADMDGQSELGEFLKSFSTTGSIEYNDLLKLATDAGGKAVDLDAFIKEFGLGNLTLNPVLSSDTANLTATLDNVKNTSTFSELNVNANTGTAGSEVSPVKKEELNSTPTKPTNPLYWEL